jgi:CheY-like chemotaxis protein
MCASYVGTEVAARTVLLVDDSDALRCILREFLSGYGFNVLDAGSGPEAIELFDRYRAPVDLLVTDIQMPGMTGLELAEYVTEREPRTAVLYISMGPVSIVDYVLTQNSSFLLKPFEPDTFLQRVRELTESASPRTEKHFSNIT